MPDETKKQKEKKVINRPDHLANERTFLAWIRTNLGLMAFGFVIERFSFFIEKLDAFLSKSGAAPIDPVPLMEKFSRSVGITIVGIGALLSLYAYSKFKKTEKQIDDDVYRAMTLLDILLALFVFFLGIFLIIYLVISHS